MGASEDRDWLREVYNKMGGCTTRKNVIPTNQISEAIHLTQPIEKWSGLDYTGIVDSRH
jgi:hypothetical protein